MAYAKNTEVSVAKSIAEIETTVRRYDGAQFIQAIAEDRAVIGFSMAGRQVRFQVAFGTPIDEQFATHRAGATNARAATADERIAKWEQRRREMMRSLNLIIKAKLEAAASGVEEFDDAFMAQIVLPDGRRVGDMVKRELAIAYEGGAQPPSLLPDYSKLPPSPSRAPPFPEESMGERWIDLDEMRAIANARFAARGEATRFARGVGLCDETILSFLRGARPPADDVLHSMGFERQIFYRRVEPCPCLRCTEEAVEADPRQDGFAGTDARMMRMFLCETCGNKRCPHANDHRHACTGSNEPGQSGSSYTPSPPKGSS